jgi:hypothetical protein
MTSLVIQYVIHDLPGSVCPFIQLRTFRCDIRNFVCVLPPEKFVKYAFIH